jgi:hypothetical protein
LNSTKLKLFAVTCAALLLSACGTFNGYTSATSEDAAQVAKGGLSEAALAQLAIVQHPDVNGGIIPAGALQRIQELAISCQWQLDPQLAGIGQAMGGAASSYGAAGAVGTGAAAAAAFPIVKAGEYFVYGGVAMLATGAVNGAISGSYSSAAAKGDCVRQFWAIDQKKNPKFEGTFTVIVYYGKAENSRPPALDKNVTVKAFPPPVVVKPVVTERPTTKADEKKGAQVKAKSKARKVEKPKALTPDQQAMKDAKATLDARDQAASDAKKPAAKDAAEAKK